MRTPMIADAVGLKDRMIAVAVKKNRTSLAAVKWAVDNLSKENQCLTIVHVMNKDDFMDEIAQGLEEALKDNLTKKAREIFNPLQSYCKQKRVHCDEVVLDDRDIPRALSDFVLKNNIDVLVLGAGSRGSIFSRLMIRKLKGPDTTSKILKNIPCFCAVYTVAKGGLATLKSSPSSSQSVHAREPEIGIQSLETQLENRLSVSGGALLPSGPVNEFEFRSPLKYCGDSDFSWVGQSPGDTDISFVDSDKPFYDHESPRLPTNSLGCGQGSYNFFGTSDPLHKTMDESKPLQLEQMHVKQVHGQPARKHWS